MDSDKHKNQNDRYLQSLLRLALEAEALEESAATSHLCLVAGSTRPQRKWLLPVAGLVSAAAAAVAVVTMVMPASKPGLSTPSAVTTAEKDPATHKLAQPDSIKSTTNEIAIKDEKLNPGKGFENPIMPGEGLATNMPPPESSVVLAIFQGLDGHCSCMHIQKEDWDRLELADKNGSQLIDVAFNSTCSQPSSKVLIVGIAGRQDSLPSAEVAEAFATSLAKMPTNSSADLQTSANELGARKLAAGMMVVTESFGASRSFPIEPAKWTPH